ncbi:MAG: DUF4085 family protein [Candidatus Onthomonas sp.]
MKYYTKEWHALCDQCGYQYDLTPSPSAKRKSETFFQSLYQQKLEASLKAAEALSKMTAEEFFGEGREKLTTMDDDGNVHDLADEMDPEEYRQMVDKYQRRREALMRDYQPEPFDREAKTAQFHAEWEALMAELSAVLPQKILDQVADLRVLALGVSTREVKREIARFCKENEARVEKANQDYSAFLERKQNRYPDALMEHYGFQDCVVAGLEWQGTDLILHLDNEKSYCQVKTAIWHQAKILEEEPGLTGSLWLQEEIYPVEGGFAFHNLLETEHGTLIYFTLQAAGIDFEFDAPAEDQTVPEQE